MSLFKIFDVAGSGMSAQSVRLNTVASNLANANSVTGDPATVYKAREPVFASVLNQAQGGGNGGDAAVGVRVAGIVEKDGKPIPKYEPGNPMADAKGYVYAPDISTAEEMANMISASRSYQNNVEVLNTSKTLLTRTLQLGQ